MTSETDNTNGSDSVLNNEQDFGKIFGSRKKKLKEEKKLMRVLLHPEQIRRKEQGLACCCAEKLLKYTGAL